MTTKPTKKTETPAAASQSQDDMSLFFTREAANEGIKLPLYLPDGTESEHYLVVRGTDSDVFRKAEMQAKRSAATIAQLESADDRSEMIAKEETKLIASLIAEWSFSTEMTQANVVKFLTEAPQIAEEVNRTAAQRGRFFKKKQAALQAGSEQKQD